MQSDKYEVFNENDIEAELSYLLDMISFEKNNASIIKSEIDKIEDEIGSLKLVIEDIGEKRDSSYNYFVPKTLNYKDKYDKNINASINNLNKELENAKNEHSKITEKIDHFEFIKKYIINKNYSDRHYREKNKPEEIDFNEKNSEIRLQILETQEVERSRIARDLHDSTVQSLTNLVHRTELCTRLLDIDIIRAKLELVGMTSSLRSIINDMRDIIYDLRPMSLTDLGLGITIKRLLDKISSMKNIQTDLKIIPFEKELSPIINITLFRIVQEACNNVVKHAEADKVSITLHYNDDNVNLEIYDNGKGFSFDVNETVINKTGYELGLSIMRERTVLLSGNFNIQTNKGKGTKIIINVPFNENKEDKNGCS